MSLHNPENLKMYFAGVVAVSLVCVHYIAHRNQAIRLAGAALPQPTPPPKKDRPTASRARRVASTTLQIIFLSVLVLSPSIVMNYVLPRIASQGIVDGFALVVAAGIWFVLNGGAWTLLEGGVKWNWKSGTKFPMLGVTALPPGRSDWTISTFSATLTAGFIAASYFGLDLVNALMVAPILIACNVNANRYSVKRLCKLITIGVAAVVGILALVFGGSYVYDTYFKSTTTPKPPQEMRMPSVWISSMFVPMMMAIPFGVIAMFMSATLRFESSGHIALRDTDVVYLEDTPIAPIKFHHTTSKPLFTAGLVSLALTGAASYLAMVHLIPLKDQNLCVLQLGLQLGNITVPAGIALTAWWTGRFGEWYRYDEASLYKGDELAAMDDVESMLDEKR